MIWKDLPKPFLVMAPLEGVTDTVFRQIIASIARPDVFFTEFTSADGFCSKGKTIVEENFLYTPVELPLVAQIWGNNPDTLYETSKAIAGRGFFGIDINMGCPDRAVMKSGGGGAMIDTKESAARAIAAIKQGIADSGKTLPMSVKTRIGTKTIQTEEWISFLLEQDIDALTIHGRTVKELSKVPAHWDEIGKAVLIRDRMKVDTVIIGNGDVTGARDAEEKAGRYGVDGVMIGRGIFQNLWAFDRNVLSHEPTPYELLDIMERHIRLFIATWGDSKNFAILRKFFKIYITGFRDAVEWRMRAMETEHAEDALALIKELRAKLPELAYH